MSNLDSETKAAGTAQAPRRLFVYNGGFLWQSRLRRILRLSGYRVTTGKPKADDLVGVWGMSPTAHRGEAMAQKSDAPLVRIEDAFLRSLHPGRSGEPPLGLLVDHTGIHFDASRPSDLETLLQTAPLDDTNLLNRARAAIARMQAAHLSKYAATLPKADVPEPGYVLVIDQTQNDASVRASRADRSRFLEMLTYARQEHPGQRILIKTHPETQAGYRAGHFREDDAVGPVTLYDGPASPWALLEGAIAVYAVSSQMGFEAILAGHKPRIFGTPFYAGWGLSTDEEVIPRRRRTLSRAQLFAGAMILYPKWYDPYRDTLGEIEDVLANLEARTAAWRADRQGWVASGMRLWKRGHLQKIFGATTPMRFDPSAAKAAALAKDTGRTHIAWASATEEADVRVEDGFLRSRGLGAQLVPPLSLALDDSGIYYDATRPSRLEALIGQNARALRPDQRHRAEDLVQNILRHKLTKYNLSGRAFPLPNGYKILVPGQVEDDASIKKGCTHTATNEALLARTRAENPDAILIWKPHPDVEAGLRPGKVDAPERFANVTLVQADMAQVLTQVDAVWTMTSLTGFEALLRGLPVTCLGAPFYAGWGLTQDLGDIPARRLAGPRPDLAALVHAALIDYPRYYDPVTKQPCPVEVAVERLADGRAIQGGLGLRLLAKAQGLLASRAHLWR